MSIAGTVKELTQRIEASGDVSPGAFNLAADLIEILHAEAIQCNLGGTRPSMRETNMMYDCCKEMRKRAASLTNASWSVSTGPPKLSTG